MGKQTHPHPLQFHSIMPYFFPSLILSHVNNLFVRTLSTRIQRTQKLKSSLNTKICKKGRSCVPLPPKEREGVAQKWNIHHVLTGNMFTQMPCIYRHRWFGHVQSQGTDRMTGWQDEHLGEKELVTKAMCVRSSQHSVAGAESPSLEYLCKRRQSIYTSAHG